MSTEVMFFFDSEDFTANHAADAIKELADICTEEGVRGHFALVGLLAYQLQAWGRRDVPEALSRHEVGTHTYGHSLHPNICQISDCESYDEAYTAIAKSECEGLGLIKGVTGQRDILFAVPPGNAQPYAALYLYADLGLPFYCDTVVTDARNRDRYYCNMRLIGYTRSVEGTFLFARDDLDAVMDDLAARDRVILYTHPNMAYYRESWDEVNYKGANAHPWGEWEEAPRRSPEETAAYFEGFRTLIRRVKADPRFTLTDLRTLQAAEKPRRPVVPADLPAIRQALIRELGPVGDPQSLSVADIFLACVRFLRGESAYTPGKVYGFLDAPQGVRAPVTVPADALRAAARAMDISRFLPVSVPVGSAVLGPADFLYAALDVLAGAETVTVTPRPQLNDMSAFPALQRLRLPGTWVHSPELKDRFLSDRLRLQAWTLRWGG